VALWCSTGLADTAAAARTTIAIESFFIWFLLSADKSGGHILTGKRARIGMDLEIFGFQNKVTRAFRAVFFFTSAKGAARGTPFCAYC
jgi:hypothetical protein